MTGRVVLGLAIALGAQAQVALRAANPERRVPPMPARPTAATYRISGRVMDAEGGGAVGDVSVTISRSDGSGAPITERAADGSFAFGGLPAAKFRLFAQRRGYEAQYYDAHENYFTAIVTGAGLKSEGLVFAIHRECSISGTVVDENGERPENAQVYLFGESLQQGARRVRGQAQVTLDAENRFHFAHLKPGRYYVAVAAQPWYAQFGPSRTQPPDKPVNDEEAAQFERVYPLTFYPGATDEGAAGAIVLAAGEKNEIDMTLQSVRAVKVQVHGTEGVGMSVHAAQQVFGAELPVPAWATTHGSEAMISVAPGNYRLGIETYPNVEGKMQPERKVTTVDATGDTVLDGSATNAMPQISGVAHVNGAMPERQMFVLLRAEGMRSGNLLIGRDGTLEGNTTIEPGTYEVSLANAQGMFLQTVAAEGAKVRGRMLTVEPGGNVKLTLDISAGEGRVKGFVRNGDEPVSAAMVLLVPEDRQTLSLYRRDQSDSDGSFQIASVVPGRYTLLALTDWNVEWATPAALEKYTAKGRAVVVKANGEVEAVVAGQ